MTCCVRSAILTLSFRYSEVKHYLTPNCGRLCIADNGLAEFFLRCVSLQLEWEVSMRIGLIAFLHESNTFAAEPTTLASFRQDVWATGDAVIDRFADAHHEMGGFLAQLREMDATPVGVFAARALPSGTIEAATFNTILERILSELDRAGPLDGILVAPHGATVAENFPDADGAWLSELRRHVGGDLPIIGTLDPHANLSATMVDATNALLAYQTNPHVDQQIRGRRAAELIVKTVRQEIAPKQAAAFPRMAIGIERQCSEESPAKELLAEIELVRAQRDLLDASLFYGFPYADVAEMGSAILCVADGDQALAQQSADDLVSALWDRREETIGRYCDVHTTIQSSLQMQGPVCLLDMGDNIGAGSAADGTWIAQALKEQGVDRAFVALCDPDTAAEAYRAGPGARINAAIGGKRSDVDGAPLTGEFTVVSLHDGLFREKEPRHGGKTEFDMGPTAILKTDTGLTLQITTHRTAPWSISQLTHCGLDPAQFQILVAKGVNAPLAAYQAVCPNFIRVDTPGTTTANMERLAYQHRRRPMYPFERELTGP